MKFQGKVTKAEQIQGSGITESLESSKESRQTLKKPQVLYHIRSYLILPIPKEEFAYDLEFRLGDSRNLRTGKQVSFSLSQLLYKSSGFLNC